MPGRKFDNGSEYRYGFNGKEKDKDISNDDYDFGARIYDGRIGRWLSIDPLTAKYPSNSGYVYTLNNPNMFYDIDGRDVGVSITKNPNGKGGTITFTSTQYITGTECAQELAAISNASFKQFLEANPNMKSGDWDVKIQMDFKVATKDDISRIQDATAGQLSDNLITLKSSTERNNRASAGHKAGSKYGNGQLIEGKWASAAYATDNAAASVSGNAIKMFTQDGGRTSIHETLHNWGLGDRYSDIQYTSHTQQLSDAKGKILQSNVLPPLAPAGVSHIGFEGTIMSTGNSLKLSQTNIDDLVNSALKMQETTGSNTFNMAIKVDQSSFQQTSTVPQSVTTQFTTPSGNIWQTTKSNPTFKKIETP